jgi:hypothetical protein
MAGQVAQRLPGQPGQQLDARELLGLDRCVEAIDVRGRLPLPARHGAQRCAERFHSALANRRLARILEDLGA